MNTTIRLFVGTDPRGGCAECQMVYDYSVKKHSSVPVEITWMSISDDPASFWHGWNTSNWPTPFSGFRYGIAEYCGYEGQAIYTDDDQVWLTDPANLWNHKIKEGNVMTGKKLANGEIRHCVSLIDCSRFGKVAPPASRRKGNPNAVNVFKSATFPLTQIIDDNWNNYDGEDAAIEDIKILHFTNMSTNPGIKLAMKRLGEDGTHWYNGPIRNHRRPDVEALFYQYYEEALAAGYRVEDYIQNERASYTIASNENYVPRNGWDD